MTTDLQAEQRTDVKSASLLLSRTYSVD